MPGRIRVFIGQIGALLMGRRTYDVVCGFAGPWPYGELPVLVATRRPLEPKVSSVRGVRGTPSELAEQARDAARDKDVYLDGGEMIRQFLDAGLVEEMTVTLIPTILGAGVPLFAGCARRHTFECVEAKPQAQGLIQLTYRPR